MKYYNPKILVAVMVFTSIVNAFSFPILGAVSSKFQFIITTVTRILTVFMINVNSKY